MTPYTCFISWWQKRLSRFDWWVSLLFFIVLTVVGLRVVNDYGAAWDELMQRGTAIENMLVIRGDKASIGEFKDRDYGPFWELGMEFTGRDLKVADGGDFWRYRHLLNHLLYLGGLLAFYALLREHYDSRWFALAGTLLLLLMPRFYAHSFFNSKDLPFLVLNIWSLYVLRAILERPGIARALLLGLVLGWTINLRIAGVMVFVMAWTLILAQLLRQSDRRKTRAASLVLIPIVAAAFNYFTWPFVYEDPIPHIQQIFANMSQFRWDDWVLYQGEYVMSSKLPWYYLPSWMALTIPILTLCTLVVGAIGVPLLALKRLRDWGRDNALNNWAVWWVGGWAPLVIIIAKHSVVYDGWRHVYFCFPYLLLCGLVTFKWFWDYLQRPEQREKRGLAAVIAVGSLLPCAIFMVRAHPHQQVFFNALAPKANGYLLRHYERDYWGASSYQILLYILQHDDRSKIRIYGSHYPVELNLDMLSSEDRNRLEIVREIDQADYYVDMFRVKADRPESLRFKEVTYSIIVQDSPVISLYRLK